MREGGWDVESRWLGKCSFIFVGVCFFIKLAEFWFKVL